MQFSQFIIAVSSGKSGLCSIWYSLKTHEYVSILYLLNCAGTRCVLCIFIVILLPSIRLQSQLFYNESCLYNKSPHKPQKPVASLYAVVESLHVESNSQMNLCFIIFVNPLYKPKVVL